MCSTNVFLFALMALMWMKSNTNAIGGGGGVVGRPSRGDDGCRGGAAASEGPTDDLTSAPWETAGTAATCHWERCSVLVL